MNLNKEISGFKNEEEFALYLNGKTVDMVYPNFFDLLNKIYNNLRDDDVIECWVNRSKRKADIYIKINGYIRGISIKKGIKNSVHTEFIEKFVSFFKEIGIDSTTVDKFKYYHYADGTINGIGKRRISGNEYRITYQNEINQINKIINDEKYIDLFVNRFILQGNKSKYEVDAIIYGIVEDFLWITKQEVYYIMRKHLKDKIDALHISLLTIQPMARNLNYNPKYEFGRNQVQLKWYTLADNIIEVMAFYRNKTSL